jgi:hypothetical protein
VTGGTVRLNGAKTVAPVRGMSQAQFDGVMAGVTDTDLAGVTDMHGRQVTADYLRAQGHLEAVDNGKYAINFAGPGEKPIYAYSGWGDTPGYPVQRFQLDLTGRKPAPPLMAQPIPVRSIIQGATQRLFPPGAPPAPAYDEHMQPPTIGVRG